MPPRWSPETTVALELERTAEERRGAAKSPSRTSSRIRLEETPSSSGTGADVEARAARGAPTSPRRPAPKRKSSPATTVRRPDRGEVRGDELLGLEARKLLRELDDEDLVGPGLLDQLEPALEGRQELHLVAEDERADAGGRSGRWSGGRSPSLRRSTARCPRWTPSNVPSATARSAGSSSAGERATITRPPPAARAAPAPGDGSSQRTLRQRPEHADPERRAYADHGAERPSGQRAERTDAPVDEVERPGRARAKAVGGEREHDRADVDVENHDAQAREELGGEEHAEHEPPRALGQRDECQRRREEHAAEDEGATKADGAAHAPGDDRPEDGPERPEPQDEPERPGGDAERPGRVEDEKRPEGIVEEVQRRHRSERRPEDRVSADEAEPDGHTVAQATLALMLDRCLLGAHAAEEERREEKRGRVGQEGERER